MTRYFKWHISCHLLVPARLFISFWVIYRRCLIRLTAYTNYALRILMYCAIHPDKVVRVEDIANAHGISRAHLLKAVRQLGQLGYLKNIRGRMGGITLNQSADAIRVGDVVRHLEGDLDLVECFHDRSNSCPIRDVCRLKDAFKAGLKAFMDELDSHTLADVTSNKRTLIALLSPKEAERSLDEAPA